MRLLATALLIAAPTFAVAQQSLDDAAAAVDRKFPSRMAPLVTPDIGDRSYLRETQGIRLCVNTARKHQRGESLTDLERRILLACGRSQPDQD